MLYLKIKTSGRENRYCVTQLSILDTLRALGQMLVAKDAYFRVSKYVKGLMIDDERAGEITISVYANGPEAQEHDQIDVHLTMGTQHFELHEMVTKFALA